ncbi:MAG: efflux RND transporter periplasmic adaptor subunit [Bdellovibrionales bacterium]
MTQQSKSNDTQQFVLLELLNFYERIRTATLQELRYISVNEVHNLVPYDQAVLWEVQGNNPVITALSGVAETDEHGEYIGVLKTLQTQLLKNTKTKLTLYAANDFEDNDLKTLWKKHLPDHVIIGHITNQNDQKIGMIMLARKLPWSENETPLFEKIIDSLSVEFAFKQKQDTTFLTRLRKFKTSKTRFIIFALLLIILAFPFRTSVLAPAEIIATKPELIRAPIDGVIQEIHVRPNDKVQKDQLLITFDQAALKAQIDVSKNSLNVAEAELRQVSQEAMNSSKAASRLSVLKGKVAQEKTNLQYYQDLLERSTLKAPREGTIIFEDVFDWLGRPVTIGERIMLIANANETELEIRLPVHEAIDLKTNTDVLFFSNAMPDKPLRASLSFQSYRANEDSQNTISYRLKANWNDNSENKMKRLGLKGTAKLYGERRPLMWQIVRKPVIAIRKFAGL